MADLNRSPNYSDHFHLSYQNILFVSFPFLLSLNYAEAFSNSRPINIYSYTIRLQNGVSCLYKMIHKTIVQSLPLLFTKYHMFKRNDIQMTEYILIHPNFLYDSALLVLGLLFLLTRYLRIDKYYVLSIFMPSGSIQFYSNLQFNMTCIYH